MFDSGLVEEVRAVLERGFPPGSKALEAHGYKQALKVIIGEIGLQEALELTRLNTRRYAKRQWTWFRRDDQILWFDGFGIDPPVVESVLARVREALSEFPHNPFQN
jgi:tRNA dimethylallyltransferase